MRYSKMTVNPNPPTPYNRTTMRFFFKGRDNLVAIAQEALDRDFWVAIIPLPEDEYAVDLRWDDGNKLEGFIARMTPQGGNK